ncbi:Chaperone protein DnaJ [Candidatus Burkholderia verschuerenii]|uniref:Chaperone protein DnaJ n=1 Tax=Candidatus Burkholderia verschuerenii TaxID=242163 RepID=A0A0L0MJC0_9BURK|nr:DnaJ domain-containing protein [Candidatus Burkholderia verschuerenii]KND62391.1 Chaperone protein DnaJ [Candidatus Burkholderia verschuerenii]
MATLYETLGVSEHASDDEIKRAYRKAAMRCHPDRNAGNEEAARAEFLEIKDAYAILSDAGQRAVYDRIFAEEMERWNAQKKQEEAERDAREAQEREAREAIYRERIALAMQFASRGHNRDVVFGVLLGRDCDEASAQQIADSAIALHESRNAAHAQRDDSDHNDMPREKVKETADAAHVNPLGAMWFQFLNNLKL